MIIIAVVCGLIGTFGILRFGKGSAEPETYELVLVAAENLPAGTTLTTKAMAMQKVPTHLLDPLALKESDARGVLGQKVGIDIGPGGYITSGALESSIQRSFAKRISHGQRALSINVSRSTGVSGLLQPGSRVDVLALFSQTIRAKDVKPVAKIALLLQNVEVLAAGKTTSSLQGVVGGPATGTYSTITLAVTPEQAELLIAAELHGRLFCVLRNPEDEKSVTTPIRSLNELLDEDAINRINKGSGQ